LTEATTAAARSESIFAVDTESGGVHNCPRCHTLVTWGQTVHGKRARFDYPADREGRYPNHHATCAADPARDKTRGLLQAEELELGCDDCDVSVFRGGILCAIHWPEFRTWLKEVNPYAYVVWKHGEPKDRRVLLLRWAEIRRAKA
jgi:hypothetical protein